MRARTELARRAAEMEAARAPFVWATVVRVEPPTSVKPGAMALVHADGQIEGFVGGACAETTVRVQALEALAQGGTRLVRITPEGAPPVEGRTAEVTVVNPCLSGGTLEILLEPEVPPPLVVVFGEGPIARALERAGEALDHEVRLTADPGEPLPADAAAVVVASHGRHEAEVLLAAVRAGVPYVGLVASRRRAAAVLDGLPLENGERARVRSPAGLDIGARAPGEVALSILAEVVSLRPRLPGAVSRSSGPESAPGAVSRAPGPAVPSTAVDPVCGMSVATVEASLHAEVGGRTVWFCGTGCRDAYLDDPGRYGP